MTNKQICDGGEGSDAGIRQIRERLAKIAPRPWRSEPMYDGGATVAFMRDWRAGHVVAAAVQGPDGWIHQADYNTPDANADFIAHAPDDIEMLLAHLAAVQQERDQAEAKVGGLLQSVQARASERDQSRDCVAILERQLTEAEAQLAALTAALRNAIGWLRSWPTTFCHSVMDVDVPIVLMDPAKLQAHAAFLERQLPVSPVPASSDGYQDTKKEI